MRMSLRLILSLVAAVTLVSIAFAVYQVEAEDRSRRTELEKRAQVLAESMERLQVTIPYAKSELVELFHRKGHVDQEEHRPDGTFITGRIPRSLQGYYAPYLSF